MTVLRHAIVLAVLFLRPWSAPGQSSPARVLAPGGTLRVSFLGGNPVQGRVNPQTGVVTGPVDALTRDLARRLGVPFQIYPVPDAASLIASIRAHQTDVGFLAWDAERAEQVEFSAPYALMGNAYLVRANSDFRQSADVDRAGVTVGTVKGTSQQIWVSEHVTRARISMVPVAPPYPELVAMLVSGRIDAFAANRQRMAEAQASSRMVRVLQDNFSVVGQALVVEKGNTTGVAELNRFVSDAITSGLVAKALNDARLAGVDVAQPPSPYRP